MLQNKHICSICYLEIELKYSQYQLEKYKKQKPTTPKTITLNMGGRVPTYAGMPMMAEGGMVKKKKKKVSKKKSIDGVARRGRTKGRMV